MALTDRAHVLQYDGDYPGPFTPPPRWITVAGAEGSDAEGFWATIRANPTNGQIQAISQPGALWADVGPWIAPLINAWNATTEEVTFEDVPAVLNEAGEETAPARKRATEIKRVDLPAPADGDWEVILQLDPKLREWLLEQVILARFHALGELGLGKLTVPSSDTPDGTPAAGMNGTPNRPSRRARNSSPTP